VTAKDQRNPGVFNREEKEQISQAVRKKYAAVALSAQGRFKYETGKKGASLLGYESEILTDMPDELLESFCGVGNPFSIWEIGVGEDVLDIGCGAGFDLIVARRKTGSDSRVCGVDITSEMLVKARKNFELQGLDKIETHQIDSEVLPFADNSFDAVISNGVINLSPAKAELFAEIYRVLRPGGRLQFADMVMDGELPPQEAASLESWSQ
jgi:SAM-dependent methyltransferase